MLFEANEEDGAFLNGRLIEVDKCVEISEVSCIKHVHQDTFLNVTEQLVSNDCKNYEMIRAYDEH